MSWHEVGGDLIFAWLAIATAYTVFTLVGFGSALIASAPLAQVMPVAQVIPLLALLDCGGSSLRAGRAWRAVAWSALAKLAPGMALGQLLGVYVLSRLPLAWMALALGGFVVVLGIRGLLGRMNAPKEGRLGAWGYALFGGVLGGLFGSGGFMYAAWLERQLPEREVFRATQAVLIALSTTWRIALCAGLGLLDAALLWQALAMLPAMLAGIWLGQHIDVKLSRDQLFRILNALLVVSGVSLIVRHLALL
ncbi:sulfite exporter TauE/SafE family protein [Azonexus sp. IMCC34839]|uniref:sulfite exporter TauE/SafE family protein n=1 Tax=Azonexus sp. IMCC34839 TaxID=3133695 RepID=UPI00399A37FD